MSPATVPSANRIQLAIVALVGASGGFVALWAEASPFEIVASTLGMLVVGVAVTAYLTWIAPDTGAADRGVESGKRRR